MIDLKQNEYVPDSVSAPGETLEEVLESRGMSQAELADRTGRPKKTINEIIRGKSAITAETAIQFERVLGIPASFWMAREQNYREALARTREIAILESEAEKLHSLPLREMAKLGWIRQRKDRAEQVDELLRFFAVASFASLDNIWGTSSPSFRRSKVFQTNPGAIAAWLRRGEIEASRISCEEFSENTFRSSLVQIRSMTRESPNDCLPTLRKLCGASGVAVVFVPEIPGTNVWGATRWLTSNRAILQLSLRYRTDDHLWFTFFHEAAHILLHGKREVFLEDDTNEMQKEEEEADSFARDWLIPILKYRAFCRRGSFSCASASRFAHEIGVSPGVVVGRLQHDGHLDRTKCNNLKRDVNWPTTVRGE